MKKEKENVRVRAPLCRRLEPVDIIAPTTPGRSRCVLGGRLTKKVLSRERIVEILTGGCLVAEAPDVM